MKTILSKITLVLFLLPMLVMSNDPDWRGKYTKEKKIVKEFTVNANALLKVDNSYGNLYITSWNENRTVIEVHIKTNSNNEEKAEKKLDDIDVEFQNSASMVSAKTVFQKSSWGWNWGNNNNVSMEINYTIKVPVNNSVDLSNDYGSINLDKINGTASISCDYGRMDLGELNADNNKLTFDYTSKATIDYMKSGKISADYSEYTVGKAESLDISADYTQSHVNEVNNLQYSCDYGSISIDKANNIQGNGDYLSMKLGTIHGNVQISSDYGSVKIAEMAADAGNLSINSDYTNISIGYNAGYAFDFEIKLDYARISGDTEFHYEISRENSGEKYYKGNFGKKGKNNVLIDSEYGNVKFNKL